jgi:hypothetical protein
LLAIEGQRDMTQHRFIFVPASPIEAYKDWKSYWCLTSEGDQDGNGRLLADVPNSAVRWYGCFGPARLYGQADFIPVQGGCVVYLGITAAGLFSELLLSSPLERFVWRAAEHFRAAERAHADQAA